MVAFLTGLKALGVATEMVVCPRGGNGIGERGHQEDPQNRVLAWCDRYLKDASARN